MSSIGGALIGLAVDIGSQAYAGAQASAASNKARGFTERMYKTRYQNSMQDMELAGINPMLAGGMGAAGSVGSTPVGVPSAGSSPSRGMMAGYSAKAQLALTKKQKKNVEADTELKGAQKIKEGYSALEHDERANLLSAQARNEDALYRGLRNQEVIEEGQQGRLMAPLRSLIQSLTGARRMGGGR